MPDPSDAGPLPPDVAVPVRAYLAAFLSPAAVDEAVEEVADDVRFWGDSDRVEVLAVAHAVLGSRLRVAPEVEVLVLEEEVGLTVPEIAGVLGVPQPQVRRMLDEALAVLADPELSDATPGGVAPSPSPAQAPPSVDAPPPPATTPSEPPAPVPASEPTAPAAGRGTAAGPPTNRRRTLVSVLAAVLAVAAVALAAAWLLGTAGGCPEGAGVCVEEVVLTDRVDPTTGEPAPDRDRFDVDEPVTLWFAFERQQPDPGPVEVRWYRDGVLLYGTEVRLGDGDALNVSLAGLWSAEPGRYRVEVAEGDLLLAERDFRIADG